MGDRKGKMSVWGRERSGGRDSHENRCEDIGCTRETHQQEDVKARQVPGQILHFTGKNGGTRGPMRREEPLWIHRSQAALAGPRDPGPVSHGPAPPGLRFCASVLPVALATGSLPSNQHCYHRCCLEPGGSSGQQWSAGSHACLRPFPVQALGKSKEGVEENG